LKFSQEREISGTFRHFAKILKLLIDEKIRESAAEAILQSLSPTPNHPPKKKWMVPTFFEDLLIGR
jgi:hypothetical protein